MIQHLPQLVVLAIALLAFPLSHAGDSAINVMRIGFVTPESPATEITGITAFWQRLRDLGWIEGKNLVAERRWVEGRNDRLPGIMADLIRQDVNVIVAGGTPAALAAKRATSTIPIISIGMGDPVGLGLAESIARPGGNLTGLSLQYGEGLPGKLIEILQETVPRVSEVAVVSNPESPLSELWEKELNQATTRLRVKLFFVHVRSSDQLVGAYEHAAQQAHAVMVVPDPLTTNYRRDIVKLAAKHRLPDIYVMRDFVDDGGLISYGVDMTAGLQRAAEYVDKIFRGATPADLPIYQATRFQLVVNTTTAQTLGITIPQSILLRADEVIR